MNGQGLVQMLIEEPDRTGEKGQRNAFLEERDEMMAYRLYYHISLCRKSSEATFNDLSREFCLAVSTIITSIGRAEHVVKELSKTKPEPKELSKKYPWYNWQVMRF